MKGIVLRSPGGLDRLELVDLPDLGAPGHGSLPYFLGVRRMIWRRAA
jgi:hypothetical protein